MKLLLIGVGYVGMALLNALQNSNHELYVTTTQPSKVELLQSHAKGVILLEDQALQDIIQHCDAMVVMVAPKNKQNYEETYLNTAKAISSALKEREKPFYIIYTSSTSVYERIEDEWATEDLVLKPTSHNANLLLQTENVLIDCAATCVLRLGGIFGPSREVINRAKYLSGKEMPGTGNEPTNHIHLDDIVSAITFCLDHGLTGIYNVVNDEHPTRKELYDTLCKKISLPSPIWHPPLPSPKDYKVSNQKIKDAGFPLMTPARGTSKSVFAV